MVFIIKHAGGGTCGRNGKTADSRMVFLNHSVLIQNTFHSSNEDGGIVIIIANHFFTHKSNTGFKFSCIICIDTNTDIFVLWRKFVLKVFGLI